MIDTDRTVGGVAEGLAAAPLRTLLYCHDTYGLGHLRRTLSLAGTLSASPLAGAQLIVSGSPAGHRFPLPPGTDLVSLPAVVKIAADHYEARSLPIGYESIRAMRRELILAAARSFRPDLVIVDHAPGGLDGEILPALHALWRDSPRTQLVLGLRDVVDAPSRVQASWTRDGTHALLDELYHAIVIYGERHIYDAQREYGFSSRAAAKTRFVGYLARGGGASDRAAVMARHDLPESRLALVTVGGGGDGARLVETVLQAVRARRAPTDLGWLVIGGPLMPPTDWDTLVEAVGDLPNVRAVRFVEDLPAHIRAADLVISMGGYNSVCEILASGRPALIVPRVEPRREQWIRAGILARRGLLRTVHPAELTAEALLREVDTLLGSEPKPIPEGMLEGLSRLERQLTGLMGTRDTSLSARPGTAAAGIFQPAGLHVAARP
ncbi:MAG: hypothetical protein M3395_06590 [Chloroflexota bacterium]|nr:hypothetical protein [Chloroflexota bacterium]